jgi:hypothetical protein
MVSGTFVFQLIDHYLQDDPERGWCPGRWFLRTGCAAALRHL